MREFSIVAALIVFSLGVGQMLTGCSGRIGTEKDPIISGHVLDR